MQSNVRPGLIGTLRGDVVTSDVTYDATLQPYLEKYTIEAPAGQGLFAENPETGGIVRIDFLKGAQRAWFGSKRNRQFPLFEIGDMFWHTGPRKNYWGIVEVDTQVPSHWVYPWIYELLGEISKMGLPGVDSVVFLQDVEQVYCSLSCQAVHSLTVGNTRTENFQLGIDQIKGGLDVLSDVMNHEPLPGLESKNPEDWDVDHSEAEKVRKDLMSGGWKPGTPVNLEVSLLKEEAQPGIEEDYEADYSDDVEDEAELVSTSPDSYDDDADRP